MNRNEIVQLLNDEIARLTQARDLLSDSVVSTGRGRRAAVKSAMAKSKRKRRMSAEAKAKIGAAAKRRWAKWRKVVKKNQKK